MSGSRYTTDTMKETWSDEYRYSLMIRVWACALLAQAQHYDQKKYDLPLTTAADFLFLIDDMWQNEYGLDRLVEEVRKREQEFGHEVEALRGIVSDQIRKIHGMENFDLVHMDLTSSDVVDLVDSIRIAQSLKDLRYQMRYVVKRLVSMVDVSKETPSRGYTHMQVAEVITHGYRVAGHLWEFYGLLGELDDFIIESKSIRGAVGSSQVQRRFLMEGHSSSDLEITVLEILTDKLFLTKGKMHLSPHATQTAPRYNEYALMTLLDRIVAASHRFALTARFLFSVGEWKNEDPAIGSSAMPHKVNPAKWEQVCSLSQTVHALCAGSWSTTANQIDMRTLDDSAQRRVTLDQVFGMTAHLLETLWESTGRVAVRADGGAIFEDSRIWSSTLLSYHLRIYPWIPREKAHQEIAALVLANPKRFELVSALRKWYGFEPYIDEIFEEETIIKPCADACIRILARIEEIS